MVVGQDILVDADVLNQLIDPLLHILRNAVDHGLESPEERVARGKPRAGTHHPDRGAPRPGGHRAGGRRRPRPRICATSAAAPWSADCWPPTPCPPTPKSRASRCCPASPRATWSPRSPAAASASTWWPRACARCPAPSTSAPSRAAASPSNCASRHRWSPRMRCSCATAARCSASPATPCAARFPPWRSNSCARTARCSRASTTTKYPGARARRAHRPAPATSPERRNLVLVDTDTGPIGVLVDAVLDASELVTRPAGPLSQTHSRRRRHRPARQRQRDSAARRGRARAQPARPRTACRGRSAHRRRRCSAARACWSSTTRLSVRRAVATLLEDQGYEIVLARDGLEAVEVHGSPRVPTCCSPISKCRT